LWSLPSVPTWDDGTKGVGADEAVSVDARCTQPTGYLGPAYGAYTIDADPSAPDFQVKGLSLPRERFDERDALLKQIDNLSRLAHTESQSLRARAAVYDEAVATLTSGAVQKAANLAEESPAVRERYGLNIYGQRVLLARRLVEAGARFVTINQAVQGGLFGKGKTNGTWDNHDDLFGAMMSFARRPAGVAATNWHSYDGPGNLPQLDLSLSSLLEDLDQRGLLDTTLVVAMGEFGRTPKINKSAGRDHDPRAGCVLLAGAGAKGGAVIGATDKTGSEPVTQPYGPADFAASIYHALGIDHHTTYYPRLPRPTPLADGKVIDGLFA
jgi:hypothetical protein